MESGIGAEIKVQPDCTGWILSWYKSAPTVELTVGLLQASLIRPALVLSTCPPARRLDDCLHNQDPSYYYAACRQGSKNKILCTSPSSLESTQAQGPARSREQSVAGAGLKE